MKPFNRVTRKAFQKPTYERWQSGKTYLGGHRKLSLDSQWFISVPHTMKKVQPPLHQAQKQDQCPDIMCHWFSSCLCPNPPSPIYFPSYTLADAGSKHANSAVSPKWLLGPCGCYGEKMPEWGQFMLQGKAERKFLLSWLYQLSLGKDHVFVQANQSTSKSLAGLCWIFLIHYPQIFWVLCPLPQLIFFPGQTLPIMVTILDSTVHASKQK